MTYSRFEDIPVWQEAIRLAEGVYDMTEGKAWTGSRSLQDQLERAALSVSKTISPRVSSAAPRMSCWHFSISHAAPPAKSAPCSVSSSSVRHSII
jgi:hypothetical protein